LQKTKQKHILKKKSSFCCYRIVLLNLVFAYYYILKKGHIMHITDYFASVVYPSTLKHTRHSFLFSQGNSLLFCFIILSY